MALIRLWHDADEWLELAPNILLPTCTEGLALAQIRLTAHYMASLTRFSTGHGNCGVSCYCLAHPA